MKQVNQSFLLSQSKAESKRLLKFAGTQNGAINVTNLTEAQALVAILKGKSNWRELALNAKMQAKRASQQDESIKITIINLRGE